MFEGCISGIRVVWHSNFLFHKLCVVDAAQTDAVSLLRQTAVCFTSQTSQYIRPVLSISRGNFKSQTMCKYRRRVSASQIRHMT